MPTKTVNGNKCIALSHGHAHAELVLFGWVKLLGIALLTLFTGFGRRGRSDPPPPPQECIKCFAQGR